MGAVAQKLLDLVDSDDPFAFDDAEIAPLQIQAAQEAFAEHRPKIALLNRLAEEAGIDEIESLADIVPLLFSHTVYKSYPQSFITYGRWDRLLDWYGSLASRDMRTVELEGVAGIDEFAARLSQAGHVPAVTSGTSGKFSMINSTEGDRQRAQRILGRVIGFPHPLKHSERRRCFLLLPSEGFAKHVDGANAIANALSWPGGARFLGAEPYLPSQASRAADMRARMLDGTVTPDEIAAFEAESQERAARGDELVREMAAEIVAHRDEPIIVWGLWRTHMAIVTAAREMGVNGGDFHPDTVIYAGGGRKGAVLPEDYQQQIFDFYAEGRPYLTYGCSECDPNSPMCEAGRYHRAPWMIWLVLNQNGDELAEVKNGVADGRFAFLSFCMEGRWGGMITGDHVQVDYEPCACGRPGPTILDPVKRYSEEQGGDDKIGCAGSMDAYLRGVVEA